MRNIFGAGALVLLLTGCSKQQSAQQEERVPNPDNSALGVWKHTEKYVSPGTLWHWETVSGGPTLTIYEDSTYHISSGSGIEFWPFSTIGSQGKFGKITRHNWKLTYFIKQGTNDSTFFYPIRVNQDTLELSGTCIEGCTYRFRKIK